MHELQAKRHSRRRVQAHRRPAHGRAGRAKQQQQKRAANGSNIAPTEKDQEELSDITPSAQAMLMIAGAKPFIFHCSVPKE